MAESVREWKAVKVVRPDESGIARLILNRPKQLNSLNADMYREIPLALQGLDDDPAVRLIIFSAYGKHFCSGIDLSSALDPVSQSEETLIAREAERFRRKLMKLQESITAFERCRKPVIAEIHGACIGAGIDMVTACDIRYCTEDANFSVKEVDVGVTADLGTLQRLPYVVGYAKAVELALTARHFDGKEAKHIGFVSGVFSSKEELHKGVLEVAKQIAKKSPLAVTGTKAVLLKSRDTKVDIGLEYVALYNSFIPFNEDIKEALKSRIAKRTPAYSKL